ncbi:MAG: hypothetical protein Kow0092_04850 [Deferrisomatales bacterium]
MEAKLSVDAVLPVVAAGCRAPSGFNRQPWACRVHGSRITVYERPRIRRPYMDADGRYTALDLGAFVAHAAAGAWARGWQAEVAVVSEGRGGIPQAVVELEGRSRGPRGALAQRQLARRVADRGRYRPAPFAEGEWIPDTVDGWPTGGAAEVDVMRVGTREEVRRLSRILARFEMLSLRCPLSRAEIVRAVTLEPGTGRGIPVPALKLGPVPAAGFRLALAHPCNEPLWRVVAWAHGRIAVSRFSSSAAVLGFHPRDRSPEAFFHLGGALGAAWLTLSGRGWTACPLAALGYLRACPPGCRCRGRREAPEPGWWTPHFPREPGLVLRVGRPLGRPSAPAPRLPVEAILDPPDVPGG